ncbi:MAG: Mur ligase family protein, partial [bacterium]|nr:Mur ligase family protein [bacterium]
MLDWLGTRVGVYGFGKTGRAAVAFLAPRLIRPLVFVDETDAGKLAALQAEAGESCDIIGGASIAAAVDQLDSLILSPGVALGNANVQRAVERGALVISELELAARYCPGHILAITGTNGKSTTTKLLGHILSAVGPTHVLGNIGTPLLGSLDMINPGDFVALEVSSFQLEAVDRFKPHVAIYTNLTPDHLDRHGSIEEYARVKRNMTRRMGPGDFVVTNAAAPEFAPQRFENKAPLFLEYDSRGGISGSGVGLQTSGVGLQTRQTMEPIRPAVEDFHRYYRRLPHWRMTGSTYWVTWRLHQQRSSLSSSARELLAESLHHFDTERYDLTGYVVMDDHVHVVVKPKPGFELQDIVKSWKAVSAAQINKAEETMGQVWQDGYFDRIIRSEEELFEKLQYIENNPKKRWPDIESYKWYYCKLNEQHGWNIAGGGSEDPPHYISPPSMAPTMRAESALGPYGRGARISGDSIHINLGGEQYELPLDCVKLPGQHNLENVLAAATTALLMGATADTVAERLAGFTGYEHRLELVRSEGGLSFYNDSKATNPEATITALKAMLPVGQAPVPARLALILGGRDKLTDLGEMVEWVKRVATHTVLIGEAA